MEDAYSSKSDKTLVVGNLNRGTMTMRRKILLMLDAVKKSNMEAASEE